MVPNMRILCGIDEYNPTIGSLDPDANEDYNPIFKACCEVKIG